MWAHPPSCRHLPSPLLSRHDAILAAKPARSRHITQVGSLKRGELLHFTCGAAEGYLIITLGNGTSAPSSSTFSTCASTSRSRASPWAATQLAQRLSRARAGDRVPYQHPELQRADQGARRCDARASHRAEGNPVLVWCASNVVVATTHGRTSTPQGQAGAEDRRHPRADHGHRALHGRQAGALGVREPWHPVCGITRSPLQ